MAKTKTQKPDADSKWADVPYDNRKAEALHLDVGESIIGRLGPVQQGKGMNGEPRRYRLLSADEGKYYLNESADFVQKGLFTMPENLEVRIERTADVDTGKPSPMKTYKIQAPRSYVDSLDLPF